jgi:hypothetical protein
MKSPLERIFVEIKNPDGTNGFRKATPEEIEERKERYIKIATLRELTRELQDELDNLVMNCDCLLFFDTEGLPYDSRACAVCGASKGLI